MIEWFLLSYFMISIMNTDGTNMNPKVLLNDYPSPMVLKHLPKRPQLKISQLAVDSVDMFFLKYIN